MGEQQAQLATSPFGGFALPVKKALPAPFFCLRFAAVFAADRCRVL